MSAAKDGVIESHVLALAGRIRTHYRDVCPKCSPDRRKEHRSERTLSIDRVDDSKGERLVFFCQHCAASGAVFLTEGITPARTPRRNSTSSFQIPRGNTMLAPALSVPEVHLTVVPVETTTSISDAALDWWSSRGISEKTLTGARVYTAAYRSLGDGIHFPYFQNGQAYSAKIRSYPDKRMSQIGTCATYWLQDQVNPNEDLVICEGEPDALAIREAGHWSAVSVPNGAPVQVSQSGKVNPAEDRKFQYVWSGKDLYDAVRANGKRIVLACDNDPPGQALAEELARRIGKARCWKVEYPADCKDANDVLIKHGKQTLLDLVTNAKPWPVSGVYEANHFRNRVKDIFSGGLSTGESTGWNNVDQIYRVVPGHLCVVTGAPGMGKTAWLNALMVNMAVAHNWRFAVQSTELQPDVHIAYLAALYMDKAFFNYGSGPRMSEADLDTAMDWVNDHFTFLHTDETPGVEDTLERLQAATMRFGIRGAVIDPASYIRRGSGGESNDHESVGGMLEAFRNFGQSHDCAMWLIAHPTKLQSNHDGSLQIPKGYNISGSAHWFNRPDVGITIHRPHDARHVTQVICWKSRFNWVAKEGMEDLFFDDPTGRYAEHPFARQPQVIYSGGASITSTDSDPWI